MPYDHATARYRELYEWLLRFYPAPFRERFGPAMGQTFNDLCRERTSDGKGLFTFVLWMFGDTFVGIVSVRVSYIFSFLIMHSKHVLRPALITALVLLIPFVAMFLTQEVDWDETDFIVMGFLVFSVTLAFELLSLKLKTTKQRVIAGIILLALFLYMWAELAVGILNIPGISGS